LILNDKLHVALLPMQLDDFVVLYVERVTIQTNHYWHSSAQNLPMAGNLLSLLDWHTLSETCTFVVSIMDLPISLH